MPHPGQECWAPEFETAPPESLRPLEDERLRAQLAYTAQASDFYRQKWAAAGVDPSRVRGVADLPLLPFTEKREFVAAQDAAAPFGSNQAAPLDRIVRMQATGGTSGTPLRMGLTRQDVEVYNEAGARSAWAAGLRPGDILLECMNYSLYAGGVSDHQTFETVGACVAPISVGNSRRLVEILRAMRTPTVLYSTPSYALHLADVARGEGIEPRELGIQRGILSGDAGLALPGYREQVEGAWGMRARDVWGMGELGAPGAECRHATGLHWLGQGLYAAEFIQPDTGRPLPFEDGAVGELVFTTLLREAHPLVRFRSHDHVRLSTRPCACGRSGWKFQILGRSDDMFIVKGINVYPPAVQDVVLQFRPELTGEFQIVIEELPIVHGPRLRAEVGADLPPERWDALRARLAARIRDVLVFSPDIELLPPGSLPRTEKKAKHLFRAYLGERP